MTRPTSATAQHIRRERIVLLPSAPLSRPPSTPTHTRHSQVKQQTGRNYLPRGHSAKTTPRWFILPHSFQPEIPLPLPNHHQTRCDKSKSGEWVESRVSAWSRYFPSVKVAVSRFSEHFPDKTKTSATALVESPWSVSATQLAIDRNVSASEVLHLPHWLKPRLTLFTR